MSSLPWYIQQFIDNNPGIEVGKITTSAKDAPKVEPVGPPLTHRELSRLLDENVGKVCILIGDQPYGRRKIDVTKD